MKQTTFVFLLCTCVPSLHAAPVDDVLAKMDSAAPKFTSMISGLKRVTYTKVLDEKATESGEIKLRKTNKELQAYIEVAQPDPKTVALRGRKAEMYLPKLKVVQEYDLGKQGSLVDQFLLMGFGTSGKSLSSSYSVKLAGQETIANQKAWHLQLVPTNSAVKDKFSRLDLWVHESGEYPVQQQFTQSSGDYYLVTYSDVKLNPPLSEDSLKLKVPSGTKREKINK